MLTLLDAATDAGVTKKIACDELGISARTVQRWRDAPDAEDGRRGPTSRPKNALSPKERAHVLEVMNSPEFRDLPPSQIVPRLADAGKYLASESTMYRLLRDAGQLAHRERSRPRKPREVPRLEATGPNQVFSWDITYLKTSVRGDFFYLYLIIDIWSRKVVGAEVHDAESDELAAALFKQVCVRERLDPHGVVLHSDNGPAMKGSTMLATLQALGVVASFSRPRVSNDNAISEALFKTMKYRPEYPGRPFVSVEEARAWVKTFVAWYNTEHRHSGIRFVTPAERHALGAEKILARRAKLYATARNRHPERWTGPTRCWEDVKVVSINSPRRESSLAA
jgi:putative transposase